MKKKVSGQASRNFAIQVKYYIVKKTDGTMNFAKILQIGIFNPFFSS